MSQLNRNEPRQSELVQWANQCWQSPEHRLSMAERSRKDCHVPNVASVVFGSFKGYTVRMFIAAPTHPLWPNLPEALDSQVLTVGFHPHRRHITLMGQMGTVWTWQIAENSTGDILLDKYLFDSKILGGKGNFVPTGQQVRLTTDSVVGLSPGKQIYLSGEILHTTGVTAGEGAAWWVIEHELFSEYTPVCYSNAPLDRFDSEGLYGTMTEDEIRDALFYAQVLAKGT